MAKFQVSDMYYGAMLSVLSKKGSIMLNRKSNQVFDLITDSCEYKIFSKFLTSMSDFPSRKIDYSSWTFTFTENELASIKNLSNRNKLIIGLFCGAKDFKDSEIAFVDKHSLDAALEHGKKSITLSRTKHAQYYSIGIGSGRKIKIPANLPSKLFN